MTSPQTAIQINTNNTGFAYTFAPQGRLANLTTLEHMKDLVQASVFYDRGFRSFVFNEILQPCYLDSHSDKLSILECVHDFIAKNITYLSDQAGGIESIQAPRETLRLKTGDCDDLSILEASILGSIGIESAFVAARYKPDSQGFDHVFLVALLPSEKVYLDPTVNSMPAGWHQTGAIAMFLDPIFPLGWQERLTSSRAYLRSLGRTSARVTDVIQNLTKPFLSLVHPVFAGLEIANNLSSPTPKCTGETGDITTSPNVSMSPVLSLAAFGAGAGLVYLMMMKKRKE
jgi:hypothetical protein